jgi:hypothetical protein
MGHPVSLLMLCLREEMTCFVLTPPLQLPLLLFARMLFLTVNDDVPLSLADPVSIPRLLLTMGV